MHRTVLVTLLATACLAAISSVTTSAQDLDPTPCEESCHEEKVACITACGEHPNPVECEAQCDEELVDCTERCR